MTVISVEQSDATEYNRPYFYIILDNMNINHITSSAIGVSAGLVFVKSIIALFLIVFELIIVCSLPGV